MSVNETGPPPGPRENWPASLTATAIAKQLDTATNHWTAIRANGVTPANGAPAFQLQARTLASFRYALDQARGYWPQATSFDLIGSDAALGATHAQGLNLPTGAVLLRMPAVLATFTIKQAA
jgi:hypothetical protein